ncbi:hypothetical protein [Kineosporia babensis]|uniref:Uncharacterized protein n=1 Tax=Kineosporia babensis TaxID=499548 RepID=A0A9X1NFM9_9ACTN|nr:hypothetical protein [Kineosporia babensis]MCD5313005.1 hypothetical protein [Kineosporia babensis]
MPYAEPMDEEKAASAAETGEVENEVTFSLNLIQTPGPQLLGADVSIIQSGYLVGVTVYGVLSGSDELKIPSAEDLLEALDGLYRHTMYDFAATIMRSLAAMIADPEILIPIATPQPTLSLSTGAHG